MPHRRLRPTVWVLIILQISIPTIMLIARWRDPSLDQMPFGWQMHTNCWGSEDTACR